ncbi:hypothetical protein JYT61_00645 [bacterium AH-315-E10]|nr:hypothetical protein [bacterium AH-315-E10]
MVTSCKKDDLAADISKAKALAAKGDLKSWKEVENLLQKHVAKIKGTRTESDHALLNFYIIALDQTGDTSKAITIAYKTVNKHSKNAKGAFLSNYLLGRLYYTKEDYSQAVTYLRQAYKLRPDDRNTLILYAVTAGKQNLLEQKELLDKLNEMDDFKDPFIIKNEQAIFHINRGELKVARDIYNALYREKNVPPEILLNIAILYDWRYERPKLAIRFYASFLGKAGNQERYVETANRVRDRLYEIRRSK